MLYVIIFYMSRSQRTTQEQEVKRAVAPQLQSNKIGNVLNLLNKRLRNLEERELKRQADRDTSVKFDETISLERVNHVFSLLDSRLSILESHFKDKNHDLDVSHKEQRVEGIATDAHHDINENDYDNILEKSSFMNKLKERIDTIENHVNVVQGSLKSINVNGISNNFVKLNTVIQKLKGDFIREINGIKKQITKEAQKAVTNNTQPTAENTQPTAENTQSTAEDTQPTAENIQSTAENNIEPEELKKEVRAEINKTNEDEINMESNNTTNTDVNASEDKKLSITESIGKNKDEIIEETGNNEEAEDNKENIKIEVQES